MMEQEEGAARMEWKRERKRGKKERTEELPTAPPGNDAISIFSATFFVLLEDPNPLNSSRQNSVEGNVKRKNTTSGGGRR